MNSPPEDHQRGVAFVEELYALLDPEKATTIATQDYDGIGLRERILCCQEMPCCDGEYAESQQSDQQERYAGKQASFAVHAHTNPRFPPLPSILPFPTSKIGCL